MGDLRPIDCRFRLQDEGKGYPRSSCTACGKSISTGLGRQCSMTAPAQPVQGVEAAEICERQALQYLNGEASTAIGRMYQQACRDCAEAIRKALPREAPASEPADGAVREAAIGLFENFVRSTACGHVVRGLITDERAAVWTQEIVDDFRASLAALSAPASSSPAEEGER